MYNPSVCLDIIVKATPAAVRRIKSYPTLYTCYTWARYQSNRALNRMYLCKDTDMRMHHLGDAEKAHKMAFAFAEAMSDMERPRPGESYKACRKRHKTYQRMAEIIRRHWDESTGLFTWGKITYGV